MKFICYPFFRWLQCALEVEQDTVAAQKLQLEETKEQYESIHERDANTIQAITKYVLKFISKYIPLHPGHFKAFK